VAAASAARLPRRLRRLAPKCYRGAPRRCVASHCDEINAIHKAERVFPYEFDIRHRKKIDELVADVFARWQSIDVLINNSGLALPETVEEITDKGWDTVMETNLRGVVQLVRAVLPHMRANESATS